MTRQTLILIGLMAVVVIAIWIFMQPAGNNGTDPGEPPPHAIDQSG